MRIFHMGMGIYFWLPGLVPTFELLVLWLRCRKLLTMLLLCRSLLCSADLCCLAEQIRKWYFPSEKISSNWKTNHFLKNYFGKNRSGFCWKNLKSEALSKSFEMRELQLRVVLCGKGSLRTDFEMTFVALQCCEPTGEAGWCTAWVQQWFAACPPSYCPTGLVLLEGLRHPLHHSKKTKRAPRSRAPWGHPFPEQFKEVDSLTDF